MSIEQKQARAVQEAIGWPYQKCLLWVRANREELYRMTGALHGTEGGLVPAAKKAAVDLASASTPSSNPTGGALR